MKISSVNPKSYISYIPSAKTAFRGLNNKETPCLFVFDLDGTLANGSNESIASILKSAKAAKASIVYATGRNLKEVYNLQSKLAQKTLACPFLTI